MKLIERQTIYDSTPELELLIAKLIANAWRYVVKRNSYWATLTDVHNGDTWKVWWCEADDAGKKRVFTDKLCEIQYYKKDNNLSPTYSVKDVQPYITTIVKFEAAFNLEPRDLNTAGPIDSMLKAIPQEEA